MPQPPHKKKQQQKEKERNCQVCHVQPFKYQHPSTGLFYCSLPCYKVIQAEVEASASASGAADKGKKKNEQLPTKEATPPPTLRPLHSLRWPEEPEEKIFDDALSRNDPKPLRRSEVFSIATNKDIRRLFTTYPNLRSVLARLDSIEIDGSRSREIIIQRVLGYDGNTLSGKSIHGLPSQLSNLQESDREALQALMQCMNNSIEACNSSSK